MKKSVIIVAGGTGTRMNAEVPKQFLLLNDKPVLMHTMQRFFDYDPKILILLVLPEKEIDAWQALVKKYSFPIIHTVTKGGSSRYQSVRKGLDKITWPCLVAVHDGVRPLCSIEMIGRCFDEAYKHGCAIPGIPVPERPEPGALG